MKNSVDSRIHVQYTCAHSQLLVRFYTARSCVFGLIDPQNIYKAKEINYFDINIIYYLLMWL